MDDVRAVMDAVGLRRAAVMGAINSAPMAITFTATYPDRVAALVLWSAYAPSRRGHRTTRSAYRARRLRGRDGAGRRRLWGTGRALIGYTVDAEDHADALRRLAHLERNVGPAQGDPPSNSC